MMLSPQSTENCANASLTRVRGFTITELIIVIAIFAVLIGAAFPAASSVRKSAQRTECLSNMRNLGQAHAMYMRDHRGRFVPADLPHGSQGDPRGSWITILPGQYMNHSSEVLRSPLDDSPFWSKAEGGHWDGMTLEQAIEELGNDPDATISQSQISRWSSYGVNGWLAMDQGFPNPDEPGETVAWTRLSQIRNPATTVHFLMMTEGIEEDGGNPNYARTDHVDAWLWGIGPAKEYPYLQAMAQMQINAHDGRPKMWDGRAGYAFLDGSVATLKFSDVFQSATANRFNPSHSHRLEYFTE